MLTASPPDPALLHERDLAAALDFIGDIGDAIDSPEAFARCGVERLPQLVASELTTMSVCDLRSGRRHVTGVPPGAIGDDARAGFDRHFHTHPLVRYHAHERGLHAHRISDSLPEAEFRNSALYDEYYRAIGIGHAVALPVHVDDGWLVSFVLNRSGIDFSDRERALLDRVRRPLAQLFRQTRTLQQHAPLRPAPARLAPLPQLTARECDVMRWVGAGKTDRDIADILGISPRTVHKHLQRVYAKLGVETRTAAAMRLVNSCSCGLAAGARPTA